MKNTLSYRQLPNVFFTNVIPALFPAAKILLFNETLAKQLGNQWLQPPSEKLLPLLLGNKNVSDFQPLAQAYSGHQFGYFTHLGDGRAMLVAENVDVNGQQYDIHLKGSGPTSYSKPGTDGKSTLGPMLREYLISEAMHALNIPTSRSLAVISTGETVYRMDSEQGAILARVAASHLRIGTFQFAAAQNDRSTLQALVDYTIARHYPELSFKTNRALALLGKLIQQQINLIIEWMQVGFIHGVMNTDNMTLSGETLDYGPCAFMNTYHPDTVFSSIDQHGRYAYGNQPAIAKWNLVRFAETLLPLVNDDSSLAIPKVDKLISQFDSLYEIAWLNMMSNKLGLSNIQHKNKILITNFLSIMEKHRLDFTNTFFALTYNHSLLEEKNISELTQWIKQWKTFINAHGKSLLTAQDSMKKVNPVIIPRNHIVEYVLKEACQHNNFKPFSNFLTLLQQPYQLKPNIESYQQVPTDIDKNYQTFCGT